MKRQRITAWLLAVFVGMSVSASPAFGHDGYDDKKVTHHVGLDVRGSWLVPTHQFFSGENKLGKPLDKAVSAHLQYSFSFPETSVFGQIYPTAYQGVGVAWNTFFDPEEMGSPAAVYVFQGAQIAKIGRKVSLDYEWNFGVSAGWHPYRENLDGSGRENVANQVVGSKVNAYINAGLMVSWRPTPTLTINGGIDLSHFSNGNTVYPNGGVNLLGARIGAAYSFGAEKVREPSLDNHALFCSNDFMTGLKNREMERSDFSKDFKHRFSVDITVFGAGRAKGIKRDNESFICKGRFGILGINVNPLYRVNKFLQAGFSVDVQYDESANIQNHVAGTVATDTGYELRFYRPPLKEQLAAGLSLRAELMMLIFTVNVGIGHNVIYKGDDLAGWYQIVALKASLTRHIFLHIGYKLNKFHDPNNLMLGVGFKFGGSRKI